MFNTQEEMIEMYITSVDKNQWKYVLVTSEISSDDLTTKELALLLSKWSAMVSSHLHTSDAAYQINAGNIFILLHQANEERFQRFMEEGFISSTKTKEGILSSILYLSHEEIAFLLNLHN